MIIILNAKFIPFDEPRKKGASSRPSRSFFAARIVVPLPAPGELRYRCVCLLQLPDQSDTQYPDTLSPTWFLNRLSRYKRERERESYIYIFVERKRESLCPANPASFPLLSSLSLARASRVLSLSRSLLVYHLNNANDWMVWVSKSRDNLYCNYNEPLYIYAVGTDRGRRSCAEIFTRLCSPRLTVSPVLL